MALTGPARQSFGVDLRVQREKYCHIGQWGTHVDPPAHFHTGLHSVDQIDPKDMLMPLVVIDVHEQAAKNPDYILTLGDIREWESRHGAIPKDAFVAMRTDWSKRWPDSAALANKDSAGVFHYPGWSKEVLQLLYEQRGITTRPPTRIPVARPRRTTTPSNPTSSA